MRLKIAIFFLAVCCIANTYAADTASGFNVYLVRHAEKQTDAGRDPELTKAGQLRAQNLALWLKDKNINAIWSSDYRRTRLTAQPVSTSTGIELDIYDAGDLTSLSEKLLENKNTAYVVGHSNTTPDLARLLCQCEIEDMEDTEYDRVIVVSVSDQSTTVKTLQQRELFITE